MDVFLAGATGAIGRPTVRILIARGHRVFAMTRRADRAPALLAMGAVPVVADIFDAPAVSHALRATRPHAVMHQMTDLAGIHDPRQWEEALQRNAQLRRTGTAHLVAAAGAAGVGHLVAQSIGWVYRPGQEPHREDDPLDIHAHGLQGVTMAGVVALEAAVLETPGLRGCVLRYGQLYGPGTGNADATTLRLPLHVHVEAAAWAGVLAVEKEAVGVYNVAEPGPYAATDRAQRELGWRDGLRA